MQRLKAPRAPGLALLLAAVGTVCIINTDTDLLVPPPSGTALSPSMIFDIYISCGAVRLLSSRQYPHSPLSPLEGQDRPFREDLESEAGGWGVGEEPLGQVKPHLLLLQQVLPSGFAPSLLHSPPSP